MAGDRPALLGLLIYLLVAAAPTLMFWLALRLLPAALDRLAERRKRRALPAGPDLQSAVATLRRLRREICGRPQATQVRRLALFSAYDDTLVDVCRIVGVDPPLAGAPSSDRDLARLLTEAALEDAGVALDPPTGSNAAA